MLPGWIEASMAIIAFVVSLISLFRTSQLENRQYALEFSQDLIGWAGGVLDEVADLRDWFTRFGYASDPPAYVDLRRSVDRFDFLAAKGRFLISVQRQLQSLDEEDEHPVIALINDFRLVAADLPTDPAKKDVEFQSATLARHQLKFIIEMQKLIRAPKRFRRATAYLDSRD
jgi:hypothetical protein